MNSNAIVIQPAPICFTTGSLSLRTTFVWEQYYMSNLFHFPKAPFSLIPKQLCILQQNPSFLQEQLCLLGETLCLLQEPAPFLGDKKETKEEMEAEKATSRKNRHLNSSYTHIFRLQVKPRLFLGFFTKCT